MSEQLQAILQNIHPTLAELTVEIEKLVYVSPRAAMGSIRTMAESLVRYVAEQEKIEHSALSFGELQKKLKDEGIITPTTDQAIHFVRRQGNVASHDGTRKMLIREALTSWEYQHLVLTWFIETYMPVEVEVPAYVEPVPVSFEETREDLMAQIEQLLQQVTSTKPERAGKPLKASRCIYYKEDALDIPDFLRDAFLLPQRFPKSTTFLLRLNEQQQARIMSELPYQLDGLHQHVKRFKDTNDACFFEELKVFVQEEKNRKALLEQYRGEVLLFYKADFIILTEALGDVALTKEQFVGQTSLLNSLHEQGFTHVRDLPKELVLLGKYHNVGETALANLFNQLKVKGLELQDGVLS